MKEIFKMFATALVNKKKKITGLEIICLITIAIMTTIISGCGTTGKVNVNTEWSGAQETIEKLI